MGPLFFLVQILFLYFFTIKVLNGTKVAENTVIKKNLQQLFLVYLTG